MYEPQLDLLAPELEGILALTRGPDIHRIGGFALRGSVVAIGGYVTLILNVDDVETRARTLP